MRSACAVALGLVLGVSVVAFPALAQTTHQTDTEAGSPTPSVGESDSGDEVAYLVDTYGLEYAEAAEQFRLQWPKRLVLQAARERFPDTYGGAWWDHSAGVINLAFTADPEASAYAAAQSFEAPERIHGVLVRYSEIQLTRTIEELNHDQEQIAEELEIALDYYWVATRENVVVVSVPTAQAERTRQYMLGRFGDRVQVEASDMPAPVDAVCSRTACDPPIRGGLAAVRTGINPFTLGFNARNASGAALHSDLRTLCQ